MQNSAVRLKAIKTGGNSLNPPASMSLNLLSGAISSLVSFTRATPATVTDFEGLIKTVKSGEVRFDGMRRVENLLSTSETLSTQSVTVIAGTYAFTLGATSTGSVTFSGASTGTLAGNGANRKYITLTTTEGSLTITVTGSVLQAQLENVTGQTNQNPSEYISTNVLSYPYQGAGVDGVDYFPYTNPNCVINGAITQIPTVSINSSNSKFAYGCAAAGDYFSTPSSTANRITGNLSLLVQVSMDTWTPATTTQCLVVKDGVSAGTRSWAFTVPTTGVLRLNVSFDGSTITSYDSTVATGFANGTVHYVGVQRESSTGIIRFYTSENGTTFTQLGSNVVGTAGALFDATTQPVQFGNLSSLSFALDGKIYDSHVYSGLNFTGTSTMVMDFDPSNWTSGTTFTGLETGEVWTLNGNAKIYQGLWDAVGPKCLLIEEARTNVFLNSTAPATQSYTTSASPYTISFYGSGSITLSGSYVAVVTGSNALTRTTLTFTPTALPLVMTVAGTITKPQLEPGSFATSYIETAGSQVTRNADQASMTGTNFSSWYNQSQGTMYFEGDLIGFGGLINYRLLNGPVELYLPGGSILNSGNPLIGSAVSTLTANSNFKAIIAIAPTSTYVFNGVLVGTSSTPFSGTPTALGIGYNIGFGQTINGHIRSIRYYSVALPSATLQALTS